MGLEGQCPAGSLMLRTRDEIELIMHEHGSCSVADLAAAIGVGQGAIRRHLDIMVADGLLDTTLERQRRGRPATRYSLSEAGEEHSASRTTTRGCWSASSRR